MNLNPMALNISGTWPGNHIAPDTLAHPVDPKVASYATGGNPLQVTGPVPRFIEPGLSVFDDPHGTLKK